MSHKILLIIILLFSLFIRIYGISSYPPSLNWDEVSHGYNAYSILMTGSDEWGEPYPTLFRAYGDYKLPIYIYLTVPFVYLFGLNPLSVRLTSVLAGTAIVFFSYLIASRLTKSKQIGLISASLVAIEPWSFFLSRPALEANLALFFILSGIYFFIEAAKNEKSNTLIISSILFSLSIWTYNSARIFTPMMLLALLLLFQKEFTKYISVHKVESFVAGLIITIFFISMSTQLLSSEGSARYDNVRILNQGAIGTIEYRRNNSDLSEPVKRLIHNRYVYFANSFIGNYNSHFNINFLFDEGGDNYQFNIQDHGLMYAISFPLTVIGIIFAFIDKNYRKSAYVLITWALLAPFAASLTRESPHTLRNIVMLPVPIIFSALGIHFLLLKYPDYKKALITIFIFVYFIFFINYLNLYFSEYRNNYSWAWQYGYEEAVDYAIDNYENYDSIIITKKYGEPHEFLLFYSKWDPGEFKRDSNLIRFYQTNWYWTDRFDKFYFINDWDIPEETSNQWILESNEEIDIEGEVLLITSPGNYPKGWSLLKSVYFLDGSVAFDIVKK